MWVSISHTHIHIINQIEILLGAGFSLRNNRLFVRFGDYSSNRLLDPKKKKYIYIYDRTEIHKIGPLFPFHR